MTPKELQEQLDGYQTMLSSGEISKEEFEDLLKGLDLEAVIAEEADDLELKAKLAWAIDRALKYGSAIL